jgi:hypothetical protein
MKKTFPPNFHLIFETDMPRNSFLVGGVEHDVPCVFQIWEKRAYPRAAVEKLSPRGFAFVEKTQSPDISFRRVGVNAGKIDTECATKSVQSHYFIKFMNGRTLDENVARLSGVVFECNNTVGPKSISKQELIQQYNIILAAPYEKEGVAGGTLVPP